MEKSLKKNYFLLTNNNFLSFINSIMNVKRGFPMDRITKPSKRLALLFSILFYAYPVCTFALWMICDVDPNGELTFGVEAADLGMDMVLAEGVNMSTTNPELWQRVGGFLATMIPGAAIMYAYHSLSRLFTLYSRGEIFEKSNVGCYRGVAWAIIAHYLLVIPGGTLTTLIMTLNNPEGERIIQVSVDDSNLSMMVVGIMILLIARIMDEGRKLKEEQALTV